jgi:S-adenosylmethionine:tRNA ribosyltransferase-isomerase
MTQTRGKPKPDETIIIDKADWTLNLLRKTNRNTWIACPSRNDSPETLLNNIGHTPLPPYIRGGQDDEKDPKRYQTVYATHPGAVAAPTAGLHFTQELLDRIIEKGITVERVTLHVGPGTFLPMTVEDTQDHVMHHESCQITPEVARRLQEIKKREGRVIAVGTTSVRTLETAAARTNGEGFAGSTNLFITPPYDFQAVDALITNFHLPRSTLLMLVSAFAGRERTLSAYRKAIEMGYRFYSYGDAMFLI